MTLAASQSCLNLIKRAEDEPGFLAGRCSHLTAYRCPAGIWTIGWGHTHGVYEGQAITAACADALLLEDVRAVEAELRPMLAGLELSQGQWDALVSLAYNTGPRRLPAIAPRFWKSLWAGDKQKSVVELVTINRAGGVVLAGLTARRKAEAALFLL
jgi:lysozyme